MYTAEFLNFVFKKQILHVDGINTEKVKIIKMYSK